MSMDDDSHFDNGRGEEVETSDFEVDPDFEWPLDLNDQMQAARILLASKSEMDPQQSKRLLALALASKEIRFEANQIVNDFGYHEAWNGEGSTLSQLKKAEAVVRDLDAECRENAGDAILGKYAEYTKEHLVSILELQGQVHLFSLGLADPLL